MSSGPSFWQRHKAKIIGFGLAASAMVLFSYYWSPFEAPKKHTPLTDKTYPGEIKTENQAKFIAGKSGTEYTNSKLKDFNNGYKNGIGNTLKNLVGMGKDYSKLIDKDGNALTNTAEWKAPGNKDFREAYDAKKAELEKLSGDDLNNAMRAHFKRDMRRAHKQSDAYKKWQAADAAGKKKILEEYNAVKQSEGKWAHVAKNAGVAGGLGVLSGLCTGKLCGGESDEKSPELTDEEKAEQLRKQKEAAEAHRKKLAEQKKKRDAKKNKKKKETKSSSGMIWFIVVFLLLAGGGAAAYFLYFKEDEEDEELGEDV